MSKEDEEEESKTVKTKAEPIGDSTAATPTTNAETLDVEPKTSSNNTSMNNGGGDQQNVSNTTNEDSSANSSLRKSRRKIDLGLDGNYWGNIGLKDEPVDKAQKSVSPIKTKRKRRTVERFSIDLQNTSEHYDPSQFDRMSNCSLSTNTSVSKKPQQFSSAVLPKDRVLKIAARSYIAVRNESDGFYLCTLCHNLYEDTKKCKIQWLEEVMDAKGVGKNKYQVSFVDWLDPLSIIKQVKVFRAEPEAGIKPSEMLVSIKQRDIRRVQRLLKQAIELTEAGNFNDIAFTESTVSSGAESGDEFVKAPESSATATATAKTEAVHEKPAKKSDDTCDNQMNHEESTAPPSTAKPSTSSQQSANNKKSHLDSVRDKVIERAQKHQTVSGGVSVNGTPDKIKRFKRIITSSDSETDSMDDTAQSKKSKPNTPTTSTTVALAVPHKPSSTTHNTSMSGLNSNKKLLSNIKTLQFQKQVSITAKSPSTPTTPVPVPLAAATPTTTPKPTALTKSPLASLSAASSSLTQIKKSPATPIKPVTHHVKSEPVSPGGKTLMPQKKPITSNGDGTQIRPTAAKKADPSATVTNKLTEMAYTKDPYFEDTCEIPNGEKTSAIQYSKLIFRTIYTNNTSVLKSILKNRIKCLHNVYNLRKSLDNPLTTLQYAILLENKQACECLIDFYLDQKENKKKTTMDSWCQAQTVCQLKDNDDEVNEENENEQFACDLDLSQLVRYCYQINCSTELFDLIVKQLQIDRHLLVNNLITAFTYGSIQLAAHVLTDYTAADNTIDTTYLFNRAHLNVILNKGDDFDQDLDILSVCRHKSHLNDSITPIHLSCIQLNNTKFIRSLFSILHIDTLMSVADSHSRKPIHYASVCDVPVILEYLLARCSSFAKQYDLDLNHNTPLHYACASGRGPNIEILIINAKNKYTKIDLCTDELEFYNRYGVGGINFANKFGQTPLHLAIEHNHYDCVKILIKYGCNIEIPHNSLTPLMYAVQLGNFKIAQALIEMGQARVETRHLHNQRTALHYACINGNTKILNLLLMQDTLNVDALDVYKNTPFYYACKHGWYFCVKLLLQFLVDNKKTNEKLMHGSFKVAYLHSNFNICVELLKPTNLVQPLTDEHKQQLLYAYVKSTRSLAIEQFVYLDVNKTVLDLKDSTNSNVLHLIAQHDATEQSSVSIAEYLLQINVNLLFQLNNRLETPLMCAVRCSKSESLIKYLFNRFFAHLPDWSDSTTTVSGGCRILRNKNVNGETLLHLLTKNCMRHMRLYEVLLTCDTDAGHCLFKYKSDFEFMAQSEDDVEVTPIINACKALGEHLEGKDDIPDNFKHFMRILYQTLKSNINKRSPLFEIVSDKCCAIFDELIEISKNVDLSVESKIDYNFSDANGCTLLQKAIMLRQIELVKLFLSKNCFNLEKKLINKNEPYLNENLLQMTIRHKLYDVYDLILDKLQADYSKAFLIIVLQTNIHSQNLLHLICSLLSLHERTFDYGIDRLKHLLTLIQTKSSSMEQCFKLLNSVDKYKCTPLHLAMLNRAHLTGQHSQHSQMSTNDFDLFLIETSVDLCVKDSLNRTPLHYLFCNFIKFKPPTRLTNEQVDGLCSGSAGGQFIDPINILKHYSNKLRSLNQLKCVDDLDSYGYSALHYAIIRNSVISVTYLIDNLHCSFIANNKKTILGNTPFSSAIYFKREWCTFELIKLLITRNEHQQIFNESYCLDTRVSHTGHDIHELHEHDDDDEDDNEDSIYLIWKAKKLKQKIEKRNRTARFNLYELILENKWHSMNWIIMDKFSVSRLNTMVACVNTFNYGLAVNTMETAMGSEVLCSELFTSNKLEYSRTLLHHLCLHVPAQESSELYNKLLEKMFSTQKKLSVKSIEQSIYIKDDFLCLPIHYACKMHNFTLIDIILSFLRVTTSPVDYMSKCADLLLRKHDRFEQCAYSLLFWKIGDLNKYDKHYLNKILQYTQAFGSAVNTVNDVKAHYPLSETSHFEYDLTCSDMQSAFTTANVTAIQQQQRISPLLYAINKQDERVVEFLLNKINMNVNECDLNGVSAFVYAIRTNNLSLVKLLLSKSQLDLSVVDRNEQTFLHHVADSLNTPHFSQSNHAILKFILHESNRANDKASFIQLINKLDSKSHTAVDYAFVNGNIDFVQEILSFMDEFEIHDKILSKKAKFLVYDQYYTGKQAVPDYVHDAEEQLRRTKLYSITELNVTDHHEEFHSNVKDLFQVDPLSTLSKTGKLLWYEKDVQQQQQQIPYDCFLIKYSIYDTYTYHTIQAIKLTHDHSLYAVFERWGKFGTDDSQAQHKVTMLQSEQKCLDKFYKLFKLKTQNDFLAVHTTNEKFQLKPNKFNLVPYKQRIKYKLKDSHFQLPNNIEYSIATGETCDSKFVSNEYQKFFVNLIDVQYIKSKWQNDYAPLTRLSKSLLDTAMNMLQVKIKPLIDLKLNFEKTRKKDEFSKYNEIIDELTELTFKYYQLIPQFDYKLAQFEPIFNLKVLNKQIHLVKKLSNMALTIKILMGAFYSMKRCNPIDYVYTVCCCKLGYLKENEPETQFILKYIQSSMDVSLTSTSRIKIERMFKIEQEHHHHHQQQQYDHQHRRHVNSLEYKYKNCVLLWFSVDIEDILPILINGVTDAHVPMWLSDAFMHSVKRTNGKFVDQNEAICKYAFACEVSLGKCKEFSNIHEQVDLDASDFDLSAPSSTTHGYDTVKVSGQYEPYTKHTIQMANGCRIPLGRLVQMDSKSEQLYNQYIVYNSSDVIIRYIVQYKEFN